MINVNKEEFLASQNALAAVLAEKYDITNQSRGLVEYLAARVLGYQNHHQLNAKLNDSPTVPHGSNEAIPITNVNQAILGMLNHEVIIEAVDDTRCAEDLTDDEINALLLNVFGLDDVTLIPGTIVTKSRLLLKGCVGFNIDYFNNRSDFYGLTNGDMEQGYTFLLQTMEDLYAQYEADDMNFYGIRISDNDFEDTYELTRSQLAHFFSQYENLTSLLEDTVNILLFKKKLTNACFTPVSETIIIGRQGKIDSYFFPTNRFSECVEQVSKPLLETVKTNDVLRIEIHISDEDVLEEDSLLSIEPNKFDQLTQYMGMLQGKSHKKTNISNLSNKAAMKTFMK